MSAMTRQRDTPRDTPIAAEPEGAPERPREFVFEHEDFLALRTLIKQVTGINLAESKQALVYGRISRRLRALGLRTFGEYRELLESDEHGELTEFCNAMTTNLTAFFRESHHFDYLRDQVLRPRAADGRASRRIRLWSAACSSGEEAYSLAMTVCESIPEFKRWDIKILATDIDSSVLQTARAGVYPAERVEKLGEKRLGQFFEKPDEAERGSYRVSPELASLITFKQLNLLHSLPMKGPLDAIFCRNVVIYFDRQTQRELFTRVSALQRANDVLFLGHSESLLKVCDDYKLVGRTIYRRA
jgi:chemotaxis protein methyltransferase CheR